LPVRAGIGRSTFFADFQFIRVVDLIRRELVICPACAHHANTQNAYGGKIFITIITVGMMNPLSRNCSGRRIFSLILIKIPAILMLTLVLFKRT
jgi:hypothetical protein